MAGGRARGGDDQDEPEASARPGESRGLGWGRWGRAGAHGERSGRVPAPGLLRTDALLTGPAWRGIGLPSSGPPVLPGPLLPKAAVSSPLPRC